MGGTTSERTTVRRSVALVGGVVLVVALAGSYRFLAAMDLPAPLTVALAGLFALLVVGPFYYVVTRQLLR